MFCLPLLFFSAPVLEIHLGADVDSQIIFRAFEGQKITCYPDGIVLLIKDSHAANREEKPLWRIGKYGPLIPFGYWNQRVCRICLYRRRHEICKHARWLCRRHTYFVNERGGENGPSDSNLEKEFEFSLLINIIPFRVQCCVNSNLIFVNSDIYVIKLDYKKTSCKLEAYPLIVPLETIKISVADWKRDWTSEGTSIRQHILEDNYQHWSR